MTRILLPVCFALAALPVLVAQDEATTQPAKTLLPRVAMKTTLGDIVLQLDGESAPVTTYNFIQYARDEYYDGTIFHRVMANFMIQGGGFTPNMDKKQEGLRAGIKNEWKNGLKNVKGSISMARMGGQPDSATSQFFINVVDNPRLDQAQGDGAAYAVFGKVVEGMDVVEQIRTTPVSTHPKLPMGPVVPVTTVTIMSVKVLDAYDEEKGAALLAAAEKERKKAEEERVKAAAVAKEASAKEMQTVVEKFETETGKSSGSTASGLHYIVLTEGEGPSPSPTSTVSVHYTGWLTNGTKFDSSVDRGEPTSFPLNRVIPGWTEGVGLMKVGEKRKLIIPPHMGYGERGIPGRIPGNSILVFDVELLEIK